MANPDPEKPAKVHVRLPENATVELIRGDGKESGMGSAIKLGPLDAATLVIRR